ERRRWAWAVSNSPVTRSVLRAIRPAADANARACSGSSAMDDVAVFDRLTAATVATHLTLMKPGDVVTEISEAISDPIASRRCKSNSIVIFAVSRCPRMLTPVQIELFPVANRVLRRPPAAPRDFEQPLPAFRRQSEPR